MRITQLAINTISTQGAGLEETCAAYYAVGFRNVEPFIGVAQSWAREYSQEGETPNSDETKTLRDLLTRTGLNCVGGIAEGSLSGFGEEGNRVAHRDALLHSARLASALGGRVLVTGTDGPPPDFSGDPLDVLAEAGAEIARQLDGVEVTVCIEFNWSPIVKSLRTACEIARRANAKSGTEKIGVLFDPAHYHCTPTKFEQLTDENIALIKHVHVNDMRDIPGELSNCNSDRVLPGEGCLDLKKLFGRLEEGGYDGYFSIEMFNEDLWKLPVQEAAQKCYDSLLPFCGD